MRAHASGVVRAVPCRVRNDSSRSPRRRRNRRDDPGQPPRRPRPKGGVALSTAFAFNALSWVDDDADDYPFAYGFGYVLGGLGGAGDDDSGGAASVVGSAPLADEVAVADTQAAAAYGSVSLPAGPDAAAGGGGVANGTVTCVARVFDVYGAAGAATAAIVVAAASWSIDALSDAAGDALGDALDAGDADRAAQVPHLIRRTVSSPSPLLSTIPSTSHLLPSADRAADRSSRRSLRSSTRGLHSAAAAVVAAAAAAAAAARTARTAPAAPAAPARPTPSRSARRCSTRSRPPPRRSTRRRPRRSRRRRRRSRPSAPRPTSSTARARAAP